MKKLSVVIPAYNEAERIKPTLHEYMDFFSKHFSDFEFIIVVEGTDNTLEIVKEFAKKDKRVKYFYSKERLGKGGAVIKGFKLATGDCVGFVDADGSTKPEAFSQLINTLKNCDGAIASRRVKGAKLLKKEPLLQRIGSRGFNILIRTLFLLPFKDTQCGAKIFKRQVVDVILAEIGITEFAFDIDLLFRAYKNGFKINELPTVWEYKTGAQFNFSRWFARLVPEMFLSVLRLRLLHSPLTKLVKVYDLIAK